MVNKNKKGFTLAELLIVVAIIAVLVAVSIPVFNAQLEKSREATDIANLRAAKAEAVSMYLLADTTDTNVTWTDTATENKDASKGFTAFYDADTGKLVASAPSKGYGKGTTAVGSTANTDFNYAPGTSVVDQVIKVEVGGETVDKQGVCTFFWVAKGSST